MHGRAVCHHPDELVVNGAESELLGGIGSIAVFVEELEVNRTRKPFKLNCLGLRDHVEARPSWVM